MFFAEDQFRVYFELDKLVMMKFVLEHVTKTGERLGHVEMDKIHVTPCPLLLTKYGSVPHLTRDSLKHVSLVDNVPLLVPYQHHVKQIHVLDKFGKGLAAFIGLPEREVGSYWSLILVF